MGSLDPSRYIFYALWVGQLDSLFDLVLINLSQDQSLGNSLNSTLVDTNSPCTWSTWARWRRSWLPQVGPPFLIALARWRLDDCSPIVHYGWATLRLIFTSPLTPQWMERFKHLISSWCSTWTCTRQSWWRSPLDVILSMGCMISSSWCKPMDTYLTPHRTLT